MQKKTSKGQVILSMVELVLTLNDKDGSYTKHAGVVLASVFSHTQQTLNVHIAHDDTVSEENISKLIQLAEDFGHNIYFYRVEIPEDLRAVAATVKKINYWTMASMFRLLFTNFIEAERVIYLDCDILVSLDINELWSIDLGNRYLGAVLDQGANMQEYCASIGLNGARYFNSGVILFHLDNIRNHPSWYQEVLQFMQRYPLMRLPDQDILNAVYGPNYLTLAKRFNTFAYDELDLSNKIVHFAGDSKWWEPDSPAFPLYNHFLSMTPWGKELPAAEGVHTDQAVVPVDAPSKVVHLVGESTPETQQEAHHAAVQQAEVQHAAAHLAEVQQIEVQHAAAHHEAVQQIEVQHAAAHHEAVQQIEVQHAAAHHEAVQQIEVQHAAAHHAAVQQAEAHHVAIQQAEAQQATARHEAAQHIVAQHAAQQAAAYHAAVQHEAAHQEAAPLVAAQHEAYHAAVEHVEEHAADVHHAEAQPVEARATIQPAPVLPLQPLSIGVKPHATKRCPAKRHRLSYGKARRLKIKWRRKQWLRAKARRCARSRSGKALVVVRLGLLKRLYAKKRAMRIRQQKLQKCALRSRRSKCARH
ncbi:glycosyltransferase family 8 protein [Paenibacillus sp. FSL K6-1230]|uniref:glycosyltransferase family 8 protein n=1 Tax=Paenibacillus sp. FSL K6-1230 TaxID=2921603 RepID=UPI0030F57BAC